MRKISSKAGQLDDKPRKIQLKTCHNQYYLPHPEVGIPRTPIKQIYQEQQKDKNVIKLSRKSSQCVPLRTYSIAQFKIEGQNLSKEQNSIPNNNYNVAIKVEGRKFRSNSNGETSKRSISKSLFKSQLNNQKKAVARKRLNLKVEPQTCKKDKTSLQDPNFDSYYNNQCANTQSKTIKVKNRIHTSNSYSSNCELNQVFNRCKKIVEEYEQKLENAKKQNRMLLDENTRLRQEREVARNAKLADKWG